VRGTERETATAEEKDAQLFRYSVSILVLCDLKGVGKGVGVGVKRSGGSVREEDL
jgi:hypothetical protein